MIPKIQCSAIEINHKAACRLKETIRNIEIFEESILNYKAEKTYDFVLIKGVLIHINPGELGGYIKNYMIPAQTISA